MKHFVELEQVDRKLLNTLQSDGRISNHDLATATAMSPSACWRRVKSLEANGTINGYTALLNANACGLNFHAMIQVTMARHHTGQVQSFITEVQDRPEVLDCFATTGDADYHLRIRCIDLDAYNDFLESFLFTLDGVSNVKTNVILRQVKHDTKVLL